MGGRRRVLTFVALGAIALAVAGGLLPGGVEPQAVLVVLAVAAGVLLPWPLLFRQLFGAGAASEQGLPAEATVLKVWDTGWTINDDPRVGLLLQVRPPGGTPYQVETKSVVSRLVVARLQPGAVVQVRYDPHDARKVSLALDARIKEGARSAAERLAVLEDLRARDLVTPEEYEAKRKEILGAV
jgi:hypothetical protein